MKNENIFLSLVKFLITGIGIGIPVTLTCITLMGGYNDTIMGIIIWTVASALLGLVSGLIFHFGKFNLPISTALHCLSCLIIAVGASTICGYGDNFFSILIKVLPIFVVVYAILYTIALINMKIQSKKVNEKLNKN